MMSWRKIIYVFFFLKKIEMKVEKHVFLENKETQHSC